MSFAQSAAGNNRFTLENLRSTPTKAFRDGLCYVVWIFAPVFGEPFPLSERLLLLKPGPAFTPVLSFWDAISLPLP